MSKLSEALRAARIHNTHNLLTAFGGPRDVAIMYAPDDYGRGGHAAHAKVFSPRFKTNPDGPWYAYGAKWFPGNRGNSIPAAKAWAAEHYGITEWAVDPTDRSNLVPADVRRKAEAFAKNPAPSHGESTS